jgi:hypothetical protein
MDKLLKMNAYSMLIVAGLVISSGCLAVGYIFAGYWQIVLLFPILLVLWLLTYRQSIFLSASIFLISYVTLAAVGVLLEFPIGLMIVTCVISLFSWELMLFNKSNAGNLPDNSDYSRKKYHLNSFALTVSVGLTLAFISANISLNTPFIVIVFLVLISIGCLFYGLQFVVKRKH